MTFTSLRSAAYSRLVRARGGGKRNSEGRLSTQGVIVAICGVAPEALAGGVGRQTPTTGAPRNGGGGGVNPSVSREVQMASATVCPQATPAAMELAFSVNASAASDALR